MAKVQKTSIRRDRALTPRQTEVLRGIASGRSVKTIARELRLSHKTVECHRQNLMNRIGIHHIPGLVRYALQMGILPGSWLTEQD